MGNSCMLYRRLEPISKLLQEHGDRCQLHNTQEVGGVILPADQQAALPLQPGEEPLDEPATVVPPQVAPVLGFQFSGGSVGAIMFTPSCLRSSSSPSLSYARSPMRCSGLASSM